VPIVYNPICCMRTDGLYLLMPLETHPTLAQKDIEIVSSYKRDTVRDTCTGTAPSAPTRCRRYVLTLSCSFGMATLQPLHDVLDDFPVPK
jgi:hypothetical protein